MTTETTYKYDNILNELYKFSKNILFLGDNIIDKRLSDFETEIGFKFPIEFIYILTKHNSFSLCGTEVLGLGKEFRDSSLDQVYYFEHQVEGYPMFNEFLPFSPDGAGNHYCLDLSRLDNGSCPVVFWQSCYKYKDKSDVETCNNSFIEWIEEVMISWTLEEIDYEGIEK